MNKGDVRNKLGDYLELSNTLRHMGGRKAVAELGTPELETLYDKIYDLEDEIIIMFGLPLTYEMRAVLITLSNLNEPELYTEGAISILENKAKEYLQRKPETDVTLLKEAFLEKFDADDILPEIGVPVRLYTRFIYNNKFLQGKVTIENFLAMLKPINERWLLDILEIENRYRDSKIAPTEAEKRNHPFLEDYLALIA